MNLFTLNRIPGPNSECQALCSNTTASPTVPGQPPDVRGCISLSQTICFETIPVFQPGLGSPVSKYFDPPCTLTRSHPSVEPARQGNVITGLGCVSMCVVLCTCACARQKFPDKSGKSPEAVLLQPLGPAGLPLCRESKALGLSPNNLQGSKGALL